MKVRIGRDYPDAPNNKAEFSVWETTDWETTDWETTDSSNSPIGLSFLVSLDAGHQSSVWVSKQDLVSMLGLIDQVLKATKR